MSKMSKSKSGTGFMDQLPTEILTLIFSKLSVKTLGRIKCVCKLWSRTIDDGIPYEPGSMEDSAFLVIAESSHRKPSMIWKSDGSATFLKISSRVFSEFAGSENFTWYNFSRTLESEGFYVDNSCHGLVCFARKGLACLLNPLTQQIIELPPPAQSTLQLVGDGHSSYSKYGLGFDSVTRTYKVVRVFHPVNHVYGECKKDYSTVTMNTQICTLGVGKKVSSWRPITCVPPRPLPLVSVAVLAGGFLHWVTVAIIERCESVEEALNRHKIVAFHLSKEEFRLISLPRSLFTGRILSYHMVDLGGVLGVVDRSRKDMGLDIWTMKDHDKEEWVNTCCIRLPIPRPDFFTSKSVIGPWENGKLLLRYGLSLISFDPNKKRWRHIYTLGLKHDKQSENNNKLLLRRTSATGYFYHLDAEEWARTELPPGFYDVEGISCFYTESLLLLSPFSKSSPFRKSD
ncbi:F-box domain containing protein [Trema orientale]|uniref:F-box domain containing protein n=1 Tax=Trema orientale TaxID=63057 RepID=A0A2P5EKK4_TREOI|nr:F-box domain containing protein [Trema orientale]